MLACSGRRDSGPGTSGADGAAASTLSRLSLSKTCVASSSSLQSMSSFAPFAELVAETGIAGVDEAAFGRVLAGGGGAALCTLPAGACEGGEAPIDGIVCAGIAD